MSPQTPHSRILKFMAVNVALLPTPAPKAAIARLKQAIQHLKQRHRDHGQSDVYELSVGNDTVELSVARLIRKAEDELKRHEDELPELAPRKPRRRTPSRE